MSEKAGKSSKIKIIIIIAAVLVIIAGGAFAAVTAIRASHMFDSVALAKSEVELGSEVSLVSFVSYDKEVIRRASVADDGGFDINKAGTYSVTYTLTSHKGKTQDFVFDVTVKDTVAPELVLSCKEVYMRSDADFDIGAYAEATDKSGSCTVKYDETPDLSVQGEYTVNVYAQDESGNKSIAQSFTLHIRDSKECDVRLASFGDSRETVEKYESAKNGTFVEGKQFSILKYTVDEMGHNTDMTYYFNKNDELFLVTFNVNAARSDPEQYIADYKDIDKKLEEKHGKPDESDTYTGSSYGAYGSDVQALIDGQLAYGSVWRFDDMNVAHSLLSSGGITHFYSYQSKVIAGPDGM